MKLTALLAGMFIALASTAAQAQANHFLVQLDDSSVEGQITERVFENGGPNPISTTTFPGESVNQQFNLFGGATLLDNTVALQDWFEAGSTTVVSDTSAVQGLKGNGFVQIIIQSDTEGGTPLSPIGGGVRIENGQFQTIAVLDPVHLVSNGDDYTFQFASDVNEAPPIPEPTTWVMMLLGLGGLGAAMRARRKSGAALAAA